MCVYKFYCIYYCVCKIIDLYETYLLDDDSVVGVNKTYIKFTMDKLSKNYMYQKCVR